MASSLNIVIYLLTAFRNNYRVSESVSTGLKYVVTRVISYAGFSQVGFHLILVCTLKVNFIFLSILSGGVVHSW